MTDEELKKALVNMLTGGVVNKRAIELLHARHFIVDRTPPNSAKALWEITDAGRKFAGL